MSQSANKKPNTKSAEKEKLTVGRVLSAPFRLIMAWGGSLRAVGLAFISLALLVFPYGYVWICGLVFDLWLKMYDAVVFIFVSMIVLWVINIAVICLLFAGYFTRGKEKSPKK